MYTYGILFTAAIHFSVGDQPEKVMIIFLNGYSRGDRKETYSEERKNTHSRHRQQTPHLDELFMH